MIHCSNCKGVQQELQAVLGKSFVNDWFVIDQF